MAMLLTVVQVKSTATSPSTTKSCQLIAPILELKLAKTVMLIMQIIAPAKSLIKANNTSVLTIVKLRIAPKIILKRLIQLIITQAKALRIYIIDQEINLIHTQNNPTFSRQQGVILQ